MNGTIYTDPHSGHEILVLVVGKTLLGTAYNPRAAGTAVAWHGDCRHCVAGRQRELSIHVKREIQMLRTRRSAGYVPKTKSAITEYTIPSNSHPHTVRYWRAADSQRACIAGEDDSSTLTAVKPAYEKVTFSGGDPRQFQSKILHRCLRLLFSGRTATCEEILACAEPLAKSQLQRARRAGFRNPCDKIDWTTICSELRRSKTP